MRISKIAHLVLASAVVTAQGCRPSAVDWPGVVSCAPAPAEIVDKVAEVLLSDGSGSLSDRAVSALELLAKEYAASTVACAVAELVDQWTQQTRSVDNAAGRRAAERGTEFLRRVGTRTQAGGS